MVTKRVRNKALELVRFDATVAGWCQFLRACGLILFSLLLYAFVEGLPGSPKEYRAAKARRADRQRRRAVVPEQGLDRVRTRELADLSG
ncbi:hypothetical protein JK364_44735 [Streptomyces sp. 110]|uniref:Uncharacterized protein n=1 Tax=Streptomyces endocoffeicus TaxID=2898945 RepID=A0ABS1Q4C5_9ACTN|nr:hypothetical protein [Streptomyces endocoffeicus]MBL1119414.1 hypothetical protein [Streptomyces endocoffeicus]